MRDPSPAELLAEVQAAFACRDLLDRPVRLSAGGKTFRVRCDQVSFSVYQVNEHHHIPPGIPGWTVCRLTCQDCLGSGGDTGGVGQVESVRQWVRTVLGALEAGEYE